MLSKIILSEINVRLDKLILKMFLSDGSSCIAIGWGVYKINKKPNGGLEKLYPDKLQVLPMTITDKVKCKWNSRNPLTVNENCICASGGSNKSIYQVF